MMDIVFMIAVILLAMAVIVALFAVLTYIDSRRSKEWLESDIGRILIDGQFPN